MLVAGLDPRSRVTLAKAKSNASEASISLFRLLPRHDAIDYFFQIFRILEALRDFRSFMSSTSLDIGYYRRFIANSSKVAKPLASLTQKIQKYEWVKEQEEAFQTLKDNLCDTPILSLPDGSKEFVVYCDASNQGLGCVLMQRGKVENATAEMLRGLDQLMERKEGGGMYLLWVSLIGDVRTLMIDEAHASRYLVHSGADKTYYDLRDMYGGHVWRRILLPMLAIV
ncbi:putative reverse transcriptase domain-containing protein [Tanacetum coccineum]|uniref:Reverse transcriptase domain-containing protein n=1 Tax=Tanacetum coccineum TaxID=301880 RepID=A0ABQ5CJQ1_9ASTR